MTKKLLGMAILLIAAVSFAEDSTQLLTIDHYVRVKSTVPSIAGQTTQIYVRERTKAGSALRTSNLTDRVVLFVHGAGTPAEVAFDVPYADYSWMAFLANAGFDVFSMDMTGYGRSTRPAAMNDPCNLAQDQQKTFVPGFISAACAPSYPRNVTTISSDWNDIDAVVDYIRAARHVDRVSLLAWSLGGPRAGGYAARHADKCPPKARRSILNREMNSSQTGIARSDVRTNMNRPLPTAFSRKCWSPIRSVRRGDQEFVVPRESRHGVGIKRSFQRVRRPLS